MYKFFSFSYTWYFSKITNTVLTPSIKFLKCPTTLIKPQIPIRPHTSVIKVPSLITMPLPSLPWSLAVCVESLLQSYITVLIYVPRLFLPLNTECDILFEYDLFSVLNTHSISFAFGVVLSLGIAYPGKLSCVPVPRLCAAGQHPPSTRRRSDCLLVHVLIGYKSYEIRSHVCLIWYLPPSPGTQ